MISYFKNVHAATTSVFSVAAVFMLMFLSGCRSGKESRQQGQQDEQLDSGAVVVAVLPTLDAIPLWIAAERGMFERKGENVVIKVYDAQMDIDTALTGGTADAALTDLVRTSRLRRDFRLSLCDALSTNLHWRLVVPSSSAIESLPQLFDHMLAMTRYSATHLLADSAVRLARLPDETVFRLQVNDISVRLQMYRNRIMDAMFLPEPQATEAVADSGRVLFSTKEKDIRLGVLTFVQDSTKSNAALHIKAISEAAREAIDSINANGLAAYRDIIIRRLGTPSAIADSICAHETFQRWEKPRQKDTASVEQWWRKTIQQNSYVERRYIQ